MRKAASLSTLLLGLVVAACGPSDFTDESLINTVRILASRSDQPYAKPGTTVHSQVLAVDARPDASANEPMRVFWLPFVCVNPPDDAFYACFSAFEPNPSGVEQYGTGAMSAGGVDGGAGSTLSGAISTWDGGPEASVGAGLGLGLLGAASADGGSLAAIPAGTDISRFLVQGPQAVFDIPSDIVSSHKPVKGATQYGVAIVFNIACAGHVELITLDPNDPDPEQIPFGCFNAQEQQLSSDDYVIGYTEVFAYTKLTNANPVISAFSFRDAGVALDGGVASTVSFPHCASGAKSCADNYAITSVPDASWERDPQDIGLDGSPVGEEIWVDYYATMGSLSDEAILLFDPNLGRITKPPEQEDLQSVTSAQHGTMWAVVHDNRGGASWITIPLNAQ